MKWFLGTTYELHYIEIESKREILKKTVNYITDNLDDMIWQDSISNQLIKGGFDRRNKIIFLVLRLFHLKEIEEGKLKSFARYKKADDELVIDQMLILSDYVDLPENEMRRKLCDDIFLYCKEIILKYKDRFPDFDAVAFIPLLEKRFQEIRNDIKALDVKTELRYDAVIIKLYEVPTKYKCNRNIVGENKSGEIIWQIEDATPSLDSPFLSIEPFDKDKIIAHNWIGANYYIDIQTGKLEIINKNARLW